MVVTALAEAHAGGRIEARGSRFAGFPAYGLHAARGTLRLTDCRVVRNYSNGVRADDGDVELTGCRLEANRGDGVYATRSRVRIERCVLNGNGARHERNGASFNGWREGTILRDCELRGNVNAGVRVYGSGAAPFVLEDCRVAENAIGLHLIGGPVEVRGTRILDNRGDGVFASGKEVRCRLIRCEVSGNGADGEGFGVRRLGGAQVERVETTPTGNASGDVAPD